MHLSNYLNGTVLSDIFGLNLKSDEVIDLLERFEMSVVYDFDRLREGTPDQYSSAARTEGFELRFDDRQVLETIWCYTRERNGFSTIDSICIGAFIPASLAEAKGHAIATGQVFSESSNGNGASSWIRFEGADMWTHFEFVDGNLSLITLMRPWN
jgi:hypothetical protein